MHYMNLIIIAVIALAIFGPKALQSMARSAGKTVAQAKDVKDKVMADLQIDDLVSIKQDLPQVPLNSRQAMEMLMAPEEGGEAVQKAVEKKIDKDQKKDS
jgi:Sec-independent protein translocase protein TatA